MKKKELEVEICILGEENSEIPITTNLPGSMILLDLFGGLGIPFKFRNKEYQSDDAWLDGNKVWKDTKRIQENFKE